ncbi:hypothetical protein AMD24_00254 [Candidatus Xiphinematobacter sp. Idaho Grape]|nr:hypothetical protein AMD24_00254 [Candidatus Xiphinematobacter sp. Idaho Grape]
MQAEQGKRRFSEPLGQEQDTLILIQKSEQAKDTLRFSLATLREVC